MNEVDGVGKDRDPSSSDSRKESDATPTLDADATLATFASSPTSGNRGAAEPRSIGPYRLITKLGEGGMGQVWLAHQTAPLQRQVALKLIRVGMYDDSVLQRFASERQALASMSHPCIAKVFDAGATLDGQPYFVMEYVPGLPLTDYCDQKRLKIRERLGLFIEVCEGVQHAHQKAIMHRDLKPANILVVEVDGKATPRIIDFGLAKAAGPEVGEEAVFTQAGGWVGTPGYMSPEQADPGVQDVDTRTDVYSLGAVLYVLLTGSLPFETRRKETMEKFLHRLREEDPPPPSTKIGMQKTSSAAAENRRTEAGQLASALHGDLDWITLKALEKDRARRYGTPSELAADIVRYLHNEPILARPASTAYRVKKYVLRHRIAVAFAASVALLLLALAITMTLQAARIARERDRANRNAQIADKNRSEATQQAQLALNTIYRVVTNTEEKLNPIAGTGMLRKELLESAMHDLDEISRNAATSNWADRTTGVALQRMGEFYAQMGMTEQETKVFQRSLQIFDRLMKENPNEDWNAFDAAISFDNLGEIGRETEPEPSRTFHYYEQSLKLREQLVEKVHQSQPSLYQRNRGLAVTYMKLSALSLEVFDPNRALNYAQKAVNTSSAAAANADASKANDYRELLSSAYFLLAQARLRTGKEAAARDAYHRSEELRRQWEQAELLSARAKQELARTYLGIGDLELDVGNSQGSVEQYQKAEAIFTALVEKDKTNPELQWYLANTQYALGSALYAAAQPEKSQAYFRRCLLTREVLLRSDPTNIQRKIELMLVEARLGRHEKALQEARAVEQYSPQHPGKLFSAACAYALSIPAPDRASGRLHAEVQRLASDYAKSAVELLREAVANGYRDVWMLNHAPDLQPLLNDSRFTQLVREMPTTASSEPKLH
jgi:serine/threonine protein kinase